MRSRNKNSFKAAAITHQRIKQHQDSFAIRRARSMNRLVKIAHIEALSGKGCPVPWSMKREWNLKGIERARRIEPGGSELRVPGDRGGLVVEMVTDGRSNVEAISQKQRGHSV